MSPVNTVTRQTGHQGPARTTQTAWSCAARAGYATAPSTRRCTSAINPAGSAARPAASPNTDGSTGERVNGLTGQRVNGSTIITASEHQPSPGTLSKPHNPKEVTRQP